MPIDRFLPCKIDDIFYCKRKPPPLVVVHQLTNWRRLRLCLNRSFPTNDHRRRLKAAASPLIGGASKTTGFTGGRLLSTGALFSDVL
jgi:hypothetical protein